VPTENPFARNDFSPGSAEQRVGRRVRSLAPNVLLATISILAALMALELALRLYHGEPFNFSSQIAPPPDRTTNPAALYDSLLGWVPRPGVFDRSATEKWGVNEAGLRNNGSDLESQERPIVVVGDSFTFGDEVLDRETWPAQLEQRLGVPVLNGGVFAYGLDQMVLRAERLLDAYRPTLVLLAFISHDIDRTEFSYYSGWKPYFEYESGALLMRNSPVPAGELPEPRFAALRNLLSYSFVFSAVLRRLARPWWSFGTIVQVHEDGERVAIDLLGRLHTRVESMAAKLVVIGLPTDGRIGGNYHTPRIIEQARQRGIQVLDLVPEVLQLPADSQALMFRDRGHYSPLMNGRIAARVALFLNPER
jgi:hypothetical protein